MQPDSTGQIQLAILTFPILGLIITLAIDSVRDEDPVWYRVLVVGGGLGAFIPTLILFGLVVAFSGGTINQSRTIYYTLASVTILSAVLLLVVIWEGQRGLGEKYDSLEKRYDSWRRILRKSDRVSYMIGVFLILLLIGIVVTWFENALFVG